MKTSQHSSSSATQLESKRREPSTTIGVPWAHALANIQMREGTALEEAP